ncbi:MAG: HAD family phosphatase [Bacteroidia bacterium]|nr:HAD family phosphatase [Bacteroidia bacterium]
MNIFAALFDMDGVIVDSNPYHKISLRDFTLKYGYTLSEEDLINKIYGRQNKEWLPNLFGELSPEQIRAYAQEKEAHFREIYRPHIKAVAGITEFIQELHHRQIPKGIGTSAPIENLDFTLEHTGLQEYFDTILTESDIHHGKPNPEIYLKLAKILNLPPEKCVVFEDSISGVEAARNAGCKVIGITTTHSPEELGYTDMAIPHFEALTIEALASLFD